MNSKIKKKGNEQKTTARRTDGRGRANEDLISNICKAKAKICTFHFLASDVQNDYMSWYAKNYICFSLFSFAQQQSRKQRQPIVFTANRRKQHQEQHHHPTRITTNNKCSRRVLNLFVHYYTSWRARTQSDSVRGASWTMCM